MQPGPPPASQPPHDGSAGADGGANPPPNTQLSWRLPSPGKALRGPQKSPSRDGAHASEPCVPRGRGSAAGQTATTAGHTATAAAAAAGLGLFLKSWVFLCRRFATVQCHNNNNFSLPSQTSRATPAFFLSLSRQAEVSLCNSFSPASVISRNNAWEWKMTRSTSKNQTLKSFFPPRGARSCPIPCGATLRAPRNNRAGHCEPQRASWETQEENSSDSWHGRSARAGAGNIFFLQF